MGSIYAKGKSVQVPPEISFRDVKKTPDIEDLINRKIAGLEKICRYMISCRVAVEQPQKHQERGNPYQVRVDITVPPSHELVSKELAGKGDMHDPLETVITRAFDGAERQLKKLTERQRGEVKTHPQQQVMGVVSQLFEDQNYGFIKTVDTGDDIYFHRHSVLHGDFDRLTIGTGVRFTAREGEKGLHASTVEIAYKPGAGVGMETA
jgi:cold shock CspA family protein/ribosome-associated translation inhibitor RaiA